MSAPRPPTFESPKLKVTQNATRASDNEYEPYTETTYSKTPEGLNTTHTKHPTSYLKNTQTPLLVISCPLSVLSNPNPNFPQHLIRTTPLHPPLNRTTPIIPPPTISHHHREDNHHREDLTSPPRRKNRAPITKNHHPPRTNNTSTPGTQQ
jgi:hypothetical protein